MSSSTRVNLDEFNRSKIKFKIQQESKSQIGNFQTQLERYNNYWRFRIIAKTPIQTGNSDS